MERILKSSNRQKKPSIKTTEKLVQAPQGYTNKKDQKVEHNQHRSMSNKEALIYLNAAVLPMDKAHLNV